eukprot:scaffold193077_cov44-Prasinocladus_malaysianus.AAC.1
MQGVSWDNLPHTVANEVFNNLAPRQAATARLVCQAWGEQMRSNRRKLRPSSAQMPRGWAKALPSLRRLDLSGLPSQSGPGQTARKSSIFTGLMREALTVSELLMPKHTTDNDLASLKGLPKLTSLSLSGCDRISGSGFEVLQCLTCVRRVDLSGCKRLTDEGLQALSSLTRLEFLSLSR